MVTKKAAEAPDQQHGKFVSFRQKLIYFGVTLIAIVFIPTLYLEAQRPWEALYSRISKAEAFLGGVSLALDRSDLSRMNQFAIDMAETLYDGQSTQVRERSFDHAAISHAFEFVVRDDRIPEETELLKLYQDNNLRYQNYHYETLLHWGEFWRAEFAKRPGLLDLFRKYKTLLSSAHDNALRSGFERVAISLIVDPGVANEGIFRYHTVYVLESLNWWQSSHPGETVIISGSDPKAWRMTYNVEAGGRPGFYHDPVFDPNQMYMPGFRTDDVGAWFGSWLATPMNATRGGIVYNVLAVDFDFGAVRKLMIQTGIAVFGAALILLLTLVLVTNRLASKLTQPIAALIEGAENVMAGNFDHTVPIYGKDEISRFVVIFNRMVKWIAEMVNLRETVAKFLSEELAEAVAKDGLALGGRRIRCTILFSDFAGFSTITQKVDAEEAVGVLNEYFGQLIPIVKKWGGFPDKYIGDAIVVLFNAPIHYENHAERAIRCAIEMQQTLRKINEERRKKGLIVFEMRIGVNTGEVVVGAIGCDLKMEYTSIGENTNLAHRMEAKCKIGHVLMSESTYEEVKDCDFPGVAIGRTPIKEIVKGYAHPVSTYGVYTSHLMITSSESVDDPSNFYRYQTRKRDL